MIRTPIFNKPIVSKVNNKDCLLCENICVCQVALYYDKNRDVDGDTFVYLKLLCNKHRRKINSDYKKAKDKLLCNADYYKDLVYGTQLLLLKFRVAECTHVDDPELLKKRLVAIHQDYDVLMLTRENKEK